MSFVVSPSSFLPCGLWWCACPPPPRPVHASSLPSSRYFVPSLLPGGCNAHVVCILHFPVVNCCKFRRRKEQPLTVVLTSSQHRQNSPFLRSFMLLFSPLFLRFFRSHFFLPSRTIGRRILPVHATRTALINNAPALTRSNFPLFHTGPADFVAVPAL